MILLHFSCCKNSTDDDARKAMRLDGGKLKEIQVRLFLSSRAEMQEVIETARQTTMSLMQMQRQPTLATPNVAVSAVLTPQSPPQVALAATMPPNILPKIQPTVAAPIPGLITQQMYQQQIQQLHQVKLQVSRILFRQNNHTKSKLNVYFPIDSHLV